MKILYIGNKLASSGRTPTTVDVLGKQFEEFAEVVSVSEKVDKITRLWDMCKSVFTNKNVDYVIIDTYSTSAFYFAWASAMCCRLLGKKYIPILHGGNLPSRLDRSPTLSKSMFNYSFMNVTPSGYLHHEFEIRGYDKLQTIPNNIDISIYKFKERKNFTPRLLWVRSFEKTYNCTMAVEVLNILIKKYSDAELCMVGPDLDGSMQDTKDLAEKYGFADHIKITGRMTKSDWHKLSEDYDIFINTTNVDNTPVSLVESMALGLPVVSTNVGGIPYMVKDGVNALLVEKGNAEEMAAKIELLVKDSQLAMSISKKARMNAESYGWDTVKKQWQNLLV